MSKIHLKKIKKITGPYESNSDYTILPCEEKNNIDFSYFWASCAFTEIGISNFFKLYHSKLELTNENVEKLIDFVKALQKNGDILFSADGEYYFAYLSKDKKTVYAFHDDYIEDKVTISAGEYYQLITDIVKEREKLKLNPNYELE
jgi:hypothetical protein